MPKLNPRRSLGFIRSQILYLGTALSIRERTEELAPGVLALVHECDTAQAKTQMADDDHLRAMALLHAAVVDCQAVLSALWSQAGMLDRLNPGEELEETLFPKGVTVFTRRAGTGFADTLGEIGRILETGRGGIRNRELEGLLSQLEEERDNVSIRLELEQRADRNRSTLADEVEQFKERIDGHFLQIEYELKKIYRRNRKLIASFFR